jgi:Cof subfamily protein (haloacid dehalogenase superfamily)
MDPDATCDSVPERIRLLISDVDGTLVTPQKALTARTCEAVNRLRDAGVALAITSSRPPRGLRMLVEPLRLTTPIAAYNGGLYAWPDMSVIDQIRLPADVARAVIRVIQSHGLSVWVYCGCDWFVLDRRGPHVGREERAVQFPATVVRDFDHMPGDAVKIVGVSDDLEAVARCEADAREEVGNQVSASRSQPYYLDVTHPRANKGNVVQRLAEMLGVTTGEIATIGDSANDVLMFARSGLSIAMGNASPEVQRAARRVTASNEQEGFARAVECYILSEHNSLVAMMAGAG